ncbi:hypothetical protein CBR_g20189 [Chara braunii]|uniref:Reverse transcriptase domain-containing protein n=1 Tax=Chara braunii TaxID=69332 RepID=A0A388KZW6_CHABU|nr:hypothetical protein CBR_g20189 [Chara braunii]|eukprot:GBG75558.1 hypothetical protein CBR_g20189 [Chara braunii]
MREDAANMPCRINPETEKALIIGESGFLTAQEEELMVETIRGRHTAYAFNDDERGRLDVDKIPMIRIHTVPHEPWNLRGACYPNPADEGKVVDYLDGKIRTHVADYSGGPYASPWFCFIKSNETLRWVQDLQRLNAVTVRDAGGLPNADALSEACAGRAIISLIDLYSGYDQFSVYPSDRPMAVMHTPRGLIHMNVAPQGWTNAVAMVQRHMVRAMQPVSPHITQPYIDDLAVKGSKVKDEQEVMPGIRRFVWGHVQDLCQVLDLLQEHNLTASGSKSKHCMRGATILGFVCDEKGRRPDTKKTNKILEWPTLFETITEIPGNKNRANGLSRVDWGKNSEGVIKDTPPVDGFLENEEDVRLHINSWSLAVGNYITPGRPVWLTPPGYACLPNLVLKPYVEEDSWGMPDVQWMMHLALADKHQLGEDLITMEDGARQVEDHERHATFPIESFLKTWRQQDLESELTFEELLDLRARQIGAIEDRIEGAASKVAYNRAQDKFRWDKMVRLRKEPLKVGDTVLLSQEGERRRELPTERSQRRRESEVPEAPPQSIQRPEDQSTAEVRQEAPHELTEHRMNEDQAEREKELDRQERAAREREIRAEVRRKNLEELYRRVEQGQRPVDFKDKKGKSVSSQQEEDPFLLSEAWENFDRLMRAARGPEGPQQEMGVKLVFADLLTLKEVMKEGFAAARASDQKTGERLTKVAQKAYGQRMEWEQETRDLKENQERQDREFDAMKVELEKAWDGNEAIRHVNQTLDKVNEALRAYLQAQQASF